MKYTLLIIFCALSITASAQFWRKKPKVERLPLLSEAQTSTAIAYTPVATLQINVHDIDLTRSVYNIEAAEDDVMKDAKHNMRYRQYGLASYNFSDLAVLYLLQNRFSEAKWYLLQSNEIARQQNDTKHTLSNLLLLADIKTQIGEIALAKADLQEAHDLANTKGLLTDLAEIDKKINYLLNNKVVATKATLRYADAVETAHSKVIVN